jgi:hypothetical protein
LVVDGLQVDWPAVDAQGRVDTPVEWRFARKAANGSRDLYARAQFNHDTIPDFAVLWGRNVQGGYFRAPLAQPPRADVPRFNLTGCSIATE